MKLLYSPTSPYVRKVVVFAHETGLFDRLELVKGSGTPLDPNPETALYNPLGKIPCLVPEDGPAIYDSRVICEYLDGLHDGPAMIPAGSGRIPVLTLQALADGVQDAAVGSIYERRLRPPEKVYEDWLTGQSHKIRNAINALESRWMAQLAGPLTLGHVAVGCMLGYIDFRMADFGWRAEHPQLADWYAEFSRRPSMRATEPVG